MKHSAVSGNRRAGSGQATVEVDHHVNTTPGDRKRVEQLEAIGTPDPNDAKQYFSWWRMRNPYMAPSDEKWFRDLEPLLRSNSDFTDSDLQTLGLGMSYSGRTTLNYMLKTELQVTAPVFKIPFFVIQGEQDMATPTSVAAEYFKMVKAPRKKLIVIKDAGHFAIVTHRAEFLAVLLKEVRPIAVKSEH